jgi:hypothetical protein
MSASHEEIDEAADARPPRTAAAGVDLDCGRRRAHLPQVRVHDLKHTFGREHRALVHRASFAPRGSVSWVR